MLRRMASFLAMVVLGLGLLSGAAFAGDACSPTNPNAKNAIVQIPAVGTPRTPGRRRGRWLGLLYKDSSFTQLSREVHCRSNKIEFATSVGRRLPGESGLRTGRLHARGWRPGSFIRRHSK